MEDSKTYFVLQNSRRHAKWFLPSLCTKFGTRVQKVSPALS